MGCHLSREDMKEAQAVSCDEEFFKLHVDSGHMNERRRSFVRRVFPTLGDALDAQEMAAAFDADSHPEVIAGHRTAEDVRNELLEALSLDDGKVNLQLFEDYYDLQSITVEVRQSFSKITWRTERRPIRGPRALLLDRIHQTKRKEKTPREATTAKIVQNRSSTTTGSERTLLELFWILFFEGPSNLNLFIF